MYELGQPWAISKFGDAALDSVDIHRVQMNALMMDSMDREARDVCS